jgi:hypothetical protein
MTPPTPEQRRQCIQLANAFKSLRVAATGGHLRQTKAVVELALMLAARVMDDLSQSELHILELSTRELPAPWTEYVNRRGWRQVPQGSSIDVRDTSW